MFTLRAYDTPYVDQTTGDEWSCEHAQTARSHARRAAIADDVPIQVLRNGRIAYVMMPDGSAKPPPLARVPERAVCTKGSGKACFCITCRAERRSG